LLYTYSANYCLVYSLPRLRNSINSICFCQWFFACHFCVFWTGDRRQHVAATFWGPFRLENGKTLCRKIISFAMTQMLRYSNRWHNSAFAVEVAVEVEVAAKDVEMLHILMFDVWYAHLGNNTSSWPNA